MKTLDYVQELLAITIEEFVEMYELSGATISDRGVAKLEKAKHLLAEVIDEIIFTNSNT